MLSQVMAFRFHAREDVNETVARYYAARKLLNTHILRSQILITCVHVRNVSKLKAAGGNILVLQVCRCLLKGSKQLPTGFREYKRGWDVSTPLIRRRVYLT